MLPVSSNPKVWISARCSHDSGLFLAQGKCCTACRQGGDLHSLFAHKIHAYELGSEKTGEARIDIDCGFFLWRFRKAGDVPLVAPGRGLPPPCSPDTWSPGCVERFASYQAALPAIESFPALPHP